MDLADLRAFTMLADALNFTRAAEALFVSQSTLSRQIGRLEEELGAPLFVRSSREVSLTEFGRVFRADAQAILDDWEAAALHARQVRAGARGTLRVGFLRDNPNEFLPAIVRSVRASCPDIALTFREYGLQAMGAALRLGEVDVAFSFSEGLTEPEGIESLPLGSSPMCAVVAADHPLAERHAVAVAELAGDPFVLIAPAVSLIGYQSVLARCQAAGFVPQIAACADIVPSLLMLVRSGIGVACLPASASPLAPNGVRFLPLSDCPDVQTDVLAWCVGSDNPCLPAFLTEARKTAIKIAAEKSTICG